MYTWKSEGIKHTLVTSFAQLTHFQSIYKSARVSLTFPISLFDHMNKAFRDKLFSTNISSTCSKLYCCSLSKWTKTVNNHEIVFLVWWRNLHEQRLIRNTIPCLFTEFRYTYWESDYKQRKGIEVERTWENEQWRLYFSMLILAMKAKNC